MLSHFRVVLNIESESKVQESWHKGQICLFVYLCFYLNGFGLIVSRIPEKKILSCKLIYLFSAFSFCDEMSRSVILAPQRRNSWLNCDGLSSIKSFILSSNIWSFDSKALCDGAFTLLELFPANQKAGNPLHILRNSKGRIYGSFPVVL